MGKRTDILAAAEQLLAERGFYGLSMKVLAQKAGIAAGTIYRYFDNKEMLLIELHRHISIEAAHALFYGWGELQPPEHQYALLWRNAFDVVLKNPQRLAVMEMLCCTPTIKMNNAINVEDTAFLPLIDFYQQGIDAQRFYNWPIPALVSLSFDSAINLAKKVLREKLSIDEQVLQQVRDASWQIIQLKNKT